MSLKISAGIIVLNGEFFLKQVLEAIYPHVQKICIAEGAVTYWQDKGVKSSTDGTIEIIKSFPDPKNKIILTQGQYSEKDDQCRTWFKHIPNDTDYVFSIDADEIHYEWAFERLIKFLEKEQPTSLGFKSDSFFGGFDRIISGFERDYSFKRILKYIPDCQYLTHRLPTLSINGQPIQGKDITGNQLYEATGITMWHGTSISPKQVYEKINYYHDSVAKNNIIDNYFRDVWLAWVLNPDKRQEIERENDGVQEFKKTARGDAFTIPFTGEHPLVIQKYMPELIEKFNKQLNEYKNKA